LIGTSSAGCLFVVAIVVVVVVVVVVRPSVRRPTEGVIHEWKDFYLNLKTGAKTTRLDTCMNKQ